MMKMSDYINGPANSCYIHKFTCLLGYHVHLAQKLFWFFVEFFETTSKQDTAQTQYKPKKKSKKILQNSFNLSLEAQQYL